MIAAARVSFRPTVLIVEDEALVREIAAEEFHDSGYDVLEAADGQTAIRFLEGDQAIDLLFTDIRLIGDVDGWSVAEAARELRPAIPVIYATGFSAEQMRVVEGGLFYKKPYKPSDIIAAAATLGVE